jgi:L-ascorbate metabolism protein UlaG (beta-lactamase superfamily)
MGLSRRQTLILGAATLGGAAVGPRRGAAQASLTGDSYPAEGGELVIHPVEHASFVMAAPGGLIIYVDPVGGAAKYDGLPPPGLILVTHEHPDHLDVPTLQAIAGGAPLLTSASVHAKLPPELQARATAIAPGEETTANDIPIAAVPAYNITEDRLKFHPRERGDNGYVLTLGGLRVYIAGDTEDTPEMRGLKDIDIAFVPMNLPYTMTVQQAAAGVAAFQPTLVYPYHYKGSEPAVFEAAIAESGAATKVVRAEWYPAS